MRTQIRHDGSQGAYGIRPNAIMMGFMDTPMAGSGIAQAIGRTTDAVRAERNAMVPRRMGNGFDTA